MKTNEQIADLIRQRKFDGVRYAAIDRLTLNKLDAQAWLYLGQAMVGLKRGTMAKLCFERSVLLDPFATWIQQAWNDATAVGEGREDKQVLKLLEVSQISVSTCILTRNNSATIRQCIESLRGAVDEIIVVDTGSTDDTVQIVESLGIEVHHFQWVDDFSAARNYALAFTTSDWIFSIDSDETLYKEDRDKIHTVASLFNGGLYILSVFQMNQIHESIRPFPAPRMFKRNYFTWRNAIHEEVVLLPSVPTSIPNSQAVNIRVHHSGYDPAQTDTTAKVNRNIHILKKSLESDPTNHGILYYLGREVFILQKYSETVQLLEKAYSCSLESFGSTLLPEISQILAESYIHLGQTEDAVRCLERITKDRPEHPNGWYLLGFVLKDSDPERSRTCLLKSKEVGLTYRGASEFDPEIATWKADHLLNANKMQGPIPPLALR